jgi:hypothetical protein
MLWQRSIISKGYLPVSASSLPADRNESSKFFYNPVININLSKPSRDLSANAFACGYITEMPENPVGEPGFYPFDFEEK